MCPETSPLRGQNHFRGYENGMYIGKLRQKIKTELPNNTDAESTEKYITEKINKIVDSKKIDVSDPNYK